MSTVYRIFGAVAPGLENAAATEAHDTLGVDVETRRGGIAFRGQGDLLWRAVTQLRCCDGIRVRVKTFPASDFATLERQLGRVPWHAYLADGDVDVRVTCRKSKLYHSAAVEERVRRAIKRPNATTGATQRVYVRIARDRVTISVDATGMPAHHRGWDKHVARAGLRETLACGAIYAAGLQTAETLWDPFCGAGTIGVEWLSTVNQTPTFGDRGFAIEAWPSLRGMTFEREAHETSSGPAFFGSDVDKNIVEVASKNLAARGFSATLTAADVREATDFAPSGAAVLCNLPYGKRLENARPALAAFGDLLRRRDDLVNVYALDGSGLLGKVSGLGWEQVLHFDNRGLRVELLRLRR